MAHHDFPASAFPDRPVPGVLTFPSQEPLHVAARLGVEPPYTDGTKPETWWADLNFHPFGPPAQDAECTLHFGGTIGRGIIAAGSTRMLGEGPPPTIRMAYVDDEGDPEMTARPDPAPKPNARWERLAIREPNGEVTYTWPDVPPTAAPLGPKVPAMLHEMIANLRQHIDERAQELAQPLIDQARADADEAREEGGDWKTRFTDLQRERQRQLQAVERRAVRAETAIARALDTMRANTLPPAAHPTDYQRGYQACADHVTTALNGATDQAEGTPA